MSMAALLGFAKRKGNGKYPIFRFIMKFTYCDVEGYCRIEQENPPPCDARIMQILEEHKQMTRGKLRQRILDEGYEKLAFRKVIRTLLQTKLTAEGDARSLNQIISLRREEDKKYAN